MADLTSKTKRNALKKRSEPHWMRLSKGCYLGFRRGPDTWVARLTVRGDKGFTYRYRALPSGDFDVAKQAAEDWFSVMGSPGARQVRRGSVRDACETYLTYLREQGREDTAKNAEQRFELIVWNDILATVPLEDLTRQDFREWRERLREGRQNRTVNRHVRGVVAALNRALKEGHSGNPEAWRVDPLADDHEHGNTVFLTAKQRQSIIQAATSACGKFLQAIAYTGARPGEIAAAVVADLDAKNGLLTLRHRKGRPPRLRARAVVLDDRALAFFVASARSKTPHAPLVENDIGEPWTRHLWADRIQEAIAAINSSARGAARIPKGASAYSYRHARISELLQDVGLDPVSVAHQTGTSVRMIEQTYYHSIPALVRDKLKAVQ